MAKWKFFGGKGGKGGLQITLTPSGKLSISLAAYEKWFKDSCGVLLAYDEENRRIGLKPVSEPCKDMYAICPSRADRRGGYCIGVRAFFKYLGLPLPQKAVAKQAYEEDGFVVIDLD